MTEQDVAETPEQLFNALDKASEGSVLDGIGTIYQSHSDVIIFVYEHGDLFTRGGFVGDTGFIGAEIEYDGAEMFDAIRDKDGIDVRDFCLFSVDLLDFLVEKLDETCDSNVEVIEELAAFADRYEYGCREEVYNSLADEYRELRTFQSEHEKNELFSVKDSDILLLRFFATMRNFFEFIAKTVTWEKEPDIGDYVTYHVEPEPQHLLDNSLDVQGGDTFEIICRVTEQSYNEEFDVNTYDYTVIAYDSIILDLYPEQWVLNHEDSDHRLLEPLHSSNITVHDERPIGE